MRNTVTFTQEWFTDIHLKIGNVYCYSDGYNKYADDLSRILRILQSQIEPSSITQSLELWDFILQNQECVE